MNNASIEIKKGTAIKSLPLGLDAGAMACFGMPLQIFFKCPIQKGSPPEDFNHRMKIFVGKCPSWQDQEIAIEAFCNVWPQIASIFLEPLTKTILIIYMFGSSELRRVLRLLEDSVCCRNHYFVNEPDSPDMTLQVAIKYSKECLEELANSEEFRYQIDTTIIGLYVQEDDAKDLLKKNITQSETLKKIFETKTINCFWVCDSDLDIITIWHRHLSPDERLSLILEKVHFDYPVKIIG